MKQISIRIDPDAYGRIVRVQTELAKENERQGIARKPNQSDAIRRMDGGKK